ncbi:hypothetical protein BSG1_19450 [Bacillus sp. SG-1]|nr:hypothetical protein BSG1_19450 [Bacillus sp. SG-1]
MQTKVQKIAVQTKNNINEGLSSKRTTLFVCGGLLLMIPLQRELDVPIIHEQKFPGKFDFPNIIREKQFVQYK